MSFLDIDERLFELIQHIEFDRSPLTRRQGGRPLRHRPDRRRTVATPRNVQVLREFRAHCKTLVAVGACAITGGLPAQRNHLDLGALLNDVYRSRPGMTEGSMIPNDPELAAAAE